jgi:hypothetical protein
MAIMNYVRSHIYDNRVIYTWLFTNGKNEAQGYVNTINIWVSSKVQKRVIKY